MGFISESIIDRVREASDVVRVVSDYVELKRSGHRWMGLCPFHGEKKPSFTVDETRQTWHCFGCGEGGNVFTFLMRMSNLTFPEAVRDLGSRFGVVVEERTGDKGPSSGRRQKLLDMCELAALFYERVLWGKKGQAGRRYLEDRGLDEATVRRFRLGLALDGWQYLYKNLMREGADLNLAEAAGLIRPRRSEGYYDFFRHRLMFPIRDPQGRVIGFGGRALGDDEAKYINSPESPLFEKQRVIYGLDQAGKAIRKQGRAILVEGYMDVLALFDHKIDTAVAPMGTALTRDHVRRLKGYGREVIMVFDGDSAGLQAAERGAVHFVKENVPARVAVLPPGEDPDSFVRSREVDEFLSEVDRASPVVKFVTDQAVAECDGSHGSKAEAVRRVGALIRAIGDPVERSLYVRDLADRLGLDESAVRLSVERGGPSRPKASSGTAGRRSAGLKLTPGFRDVLALCIGDGKIRSRLVESKMLSDMDGDDQVSALLRAIVDLHQRPGAVWPADLISRLEDEKLQSEVVQLYARAGEVRDPSRLADDFLLKMERGRLQRRIKDAQLQVRAAQESGDKEKELSADSLYNDLQRQLRNLNEAAS